MLFQLRGFPFSLIVVLTFALQVLFQHTCLVLMAFNYLFFKIFLVEKKFVLTFV